MYHQTNIIEQALAWARIYRLVYIKPISNLLSESRLTKEMILWQCELRMWQQTACNNSYGSDYDNVQLKGSYSTLFLLGWMYFAESWIYYLENKQKLRIKNSHLMSNLNHFLTQTLVRSYEPGILRHPFLRSVCKSLVGLGHHGG